MGVWVSHIPLIFSLNIPYPFNFVVSYSYNDETGDVIPWNRKLMKMTGSISVHFDEYY